MRWIALLPLLFLTACGGTIVFSENVDVKNEAAATFTLEASDLEHEIRLVVVETTRTTPREPYDSISGAITDPNGVEHEFKRQGCTFFSAKKAATRNTGTCTVVLKNLQPVVAGEHTIVVDAGPSFNLLGSETELVVKRLD